MLKISFFFSDEIFIFIISDIAWVCFRNAFRTNCNRLHKTTKLIGIYEVLKILIAGIRNEAMMV